MNKSIFAVLLVWFLIIATNYRTSAVFKDKAQQASGAVFVKGVFECSGTAIGGGLFLTARHCIVDEGDNFKSGFTVSFAGNERGPFYIARVVALSQTDDVAVLGLVNGGSVPTIRLGDEHKLQAGDQILNVGFPASAGKQTFFGTFVIPEFLHTPPNTESFPEWVNGMPVNIVSIGGSSGSGLFDPEQRKLIGILVGGGTTSYAVAIPVSRAWELLKHLPESTPAAYAKTHPAHEVESDFLF